MYIDKKFGSCDWLGHVIYFRDVGDGWVEWAIAHPDFAGIEKRTKTKIDNLLLFAHRALSIASYVTVFLRELSWGFLEVGPARFLLKMQPE